MFLADGTRTAASQLVEWMLLNSGLDFEGDLTCVVYRIDPITGYQFVVAMVGVKHVAPMFGPLVYDDVRLGPSGHVNEYGFQRREAIAVSDNGDALVDSFPDRPRSSGWVAWLSSRTSDAWDESRRTFREEIVPQLSLALEPPGHPEPLFPELWDRERVAHNNLRRSLLTVEPLCTVDDLVSQVKHGLRTGLRRVGHGIHHLGVYLSTGEVWRLRGSSDAALPNEIDEIGEHGERYAENPVDRGLFTTVSDSTRPMLLATEDHEQWISRLLIGDDSDRFRRIVESPLFRGGMVLPVLYPYDHQQTIAVVVVLAVETPPLVPADLFVMSKLAEEAGDHLAHHLPIPGYPRWPEPGMRSRRKPTSPDRSKESAHRLASQMLHSSAGFELTQLDEGMSGTFVYRVDAEASRDRVEIPRVLKVGPAEEIVSEFANYDFFVKRTAVGQSSRVDEQLVTGNEGAILYTFVGAGDRAQPWSEWLIAAPDPVVSWALDRLFRKLRSWYDVSRPKAISLRDALVDTEFVSTNWWRNGVDAKERQINRAFTNPGIDDVHDQLKRLAEQGQCDPDMTVSVVHGDLHTGNVFSIFGSEDVGADVGNGDKGTPFSAPDVALIDWGLTANDQYVMKDFVKLAIDALFSVRFSDLSQGDDGAERWHNLATLFDTKLCEFSRHARGGQWRYAYVHYLAKMVFYISRDGKTYLTDDARKAAFEELEGNVDYLCGDCAVDDAPRLGSFIGTR